MTISVIQKVGTMEELQKLYDQFINSNMVAAFDDQIKLFGDICEDARKSLESALESLTTANGHEEDRTRQVFRGNHDKHSDRHNYR